MNIFLSTSSILIQNVPEKQLIFQQYISYVHISSVPIICQQNNYVKGIIEGLSKFLNYFLKN